MHFISVTARRRTGSKVFIAFILQQRWYLDLSLFTTAPEGTLQQALGWRFPRELFPPPSWICTHFKPSPGRNSRAVMKLLGFWHENIQRNKLPAWAGNTESFTASLFSPCRRAWEGWGWDLGSLQESSCASASPISVPSHGQLLISAVTAISHNEETRKKPSILTQTHIRYYLGLTADLISTDPVVWVGWSFCAWVRVHFVPNSNLSVITVFIIFKQSRNSKKTFF